MLTQDSLSFVGSVATGAASAPSTGAAAATGASSTVGGTTADQSQVRLVNRRDAFGHAQIFDVN